MLLRPLTLVLGACSLAAAPALLTASFLGAPAGAAVPFRQLDLPPLSPPVFDTKDPWAPRLRTLLEGEVVLTSAAQVHDVWKRLFQQPFDPSRVDFEQEFVVWMGAGLQALGSFEIDCVEEVAAEWTEPGGSRTDPFLAVTGTTTLPGVPPPDPPPPTWRLAAVVLPRALHDDVVFHRRVVALP